MGNPYWHPDHKFRRRVAYRIYDELRSEFVFEAQMEAPRVKIISDGSPAARSLGWCFVPNPELVALKLSGGDR